MSVSKLSQEQVAEVMVDLKAGSREISTYSSRTVRRSFSATGCPFARKVLGRNSMCMMTSNIFGAIAAENLGYAKVELQETIAKGDPGCRLVVYLKPAPESDAREGREYYGSEGCG